MTALVSLDGADRTVSYFADVEDLNSSIDHSSRAIVHSETHMLRSPNEA